MIISNGDAMFACVYLSVLNVYVLVVLFDHCHMSSCRCVIVLRYHHKALRNLALEMHNINKLTYLLTNSLTNYINN